MFFRLSYVWEWTYIVILLEDKGAGNFNSQVKDISNKYLYNVCFRFVQPLLDAQAELNKLDERERSGGRQKRKLRHVSLSVNILAWSEMEMGNVLTLFNHATNKGKTAGRCKFDTHLTEIG